MSYECLYHVIFTGEMCLPELQKPSDDSPVSDIELVVSDEASDEDGEGNQSISDIESSSESSIGK